MKTQFQILILLLTVPALTGCISPFRNTETVEYQDPVLPMTMGRTALVAHLNDRNRGLQGWRCTSTSLHVRMPNGIAQRLTGNIACQAPQYFRLTAHNVIASTDIGSNATRCWFYARPGDPAVITWKHEDTPLLCRMPAGVPYIDPYWLMLVLGVTPLNEADYKLSRGPAGTTELWLTAMEANPNGGTMRRVIKVDTIHGVIREHALYDGDANPLVRAELSHHQNCSGVMLPRRVRLLFPQMDWELTLKFDGVETNPHLPDALWRLPDQNMEVVDIGEIIRRRLIAEGGSPNAVANGFRTAPRVHLMTPEFSSPVRSASAAPAPEFDEPRRVPINEPEEPDWDLPISATRELPSQESSGGNFREPVVPAPPARRTLWSLFRRR